MDKKDVKIEKLILNIECEKVALTMEQAKKLKSLLDELFGKEVIKEVVEKHHYHDWYYRPYISWYETSAKPEMNLPQTYCSAGTLELSV